MDTLYTFGGNSTHYKTESVMGLMNSATSGSCSSVDKRKVDWQKRVPFRPFKV